MNRNDSGEPADGSGGCGRDAAAVNYKTRKRPTDTVFTITDGIDAAPETCTCCPPPVVNGQQQRRRPRTWTCGGVGGGGGGGSSLTRSRTFTSNYERAISSLLWQPYECRSSSSNSLDDDGDVAVWLNSTGRYEPLSSRSSLSLSTIPRSAVSCSSSVCRLLDDGGGGDKTPPSPCWCTAETAVSDPNNEAAAVTGGRTTTGYRCPPRGTLLQRQSTAAAAATTDGGRPLLLLRPATAAVQSNVQRPPSRVVPSLRCVSAGDWCCDNVVVDVQQDEDGEDDDDQEEYDNDEGCYYNYEEPEDHRRTVVNDADVKVRDDNRVRVVVMNNGCGLMTGGSVVVVGTDAQGRGGVGGTDGKPPPVVAERTFASTEAQTDETACSSAYREQRRRERRERRQQQRRVHPPPPPPPALSTSTLLLPPPPQSAVNGATIAVPIDSDRLPDLLLNSHLPPPLYTTVGGGGDDGGMGGMCDVAMATRVATFPASLLSTGFQHPSHQSSRAPAGPAAPTSINPPGGFRLPFGFIPARRRRSLHYCSEEDTPKSCCGLLTLPDATSTVSIRWFIGIVFIAGICSALVGTVLGATRASGREHLTVALLMIGVGVILVAISGIAWRLTAGQEASSCGAVFGLGRSLDDAAEANRRFVPRLPPSYGRPHHPYAAMMYPEFEYRAPPPSYQASMQEYRLRLLLLDRQTNMPPVTASPPPTYRSQPGTLIRGQNVCCRGDPGELYLYQPSALIGHHQAADYSGPPSYRSRTSTLRPGCHLIDPASATMVMGSAAVMGSRNHSRNPSQLSAMSEVMGGGGGVGGCGVVVIGGGGGSMMTSVDNKLLPPSAVDDHDNDGGGGVMVVDDGRTRDIVVVDEKKVDHRRRTSGGMVTVVQTAQPPTVHPSPGTVIVTVSGANITAATAPNTTTTNTINTTTAGCNVRCRETEMEILAHL